MKTFVYKSKKDLVDGIKAYKKFSKKKLKLYAVEYNRRHLIGIEDYDGDHFWALPSDLAEKLKLDVEGGMGKLAFKLSTKVRKK